MARRRANNEGTIFYRASRGEWVAQVSLNGKRLTKYAKTQRECREWVKETQIKIGNGLTFSGTQVTLAKFIETWLDGKGLSRRPRTVLQYRQICDFHILPHLGKMRLQEIQPVHLNQLYLMKKEEGRGARTVQLIHIVMHCVLQQAMKEGILGRNPADAVQRPKVEETERHILTEEQAQRLVIASQGKRFGVLYYLALMTGMREGELLGLKWEDLDWTRGIVEVKRQLQRSAGQGLALVPPKTKAGRRQIKIGQETLERLAAHRSQQDLQKSAMGDRWVENDLIFPNTLGKPLSGRDMIIEFKSLLKKNGLPNIRFHDLRHTSLSFLLNSGTPVITVQHRAGHSKASITTDTYGHSMGHSEDEAAIRIEEMITPVAVKLLSK
jgi:integrase